MATLIGIAGSADGRHFPLGERKLVSFGRDDMCTYQIIDEEISRKHLQIRVQGEHHLAGDCRSANGVFVNGARIVKPVILAQGDVIELGRARLAYTTDDFADDASATARIENLKSEWSRSTLIRSKSDDA